MNGPHRCAHIFICNSLLWNSANWHLQKNCFIVTWVLNREQLYRFLKFPWHSKQNFTGQFLSPCCSELCYASRNRVFIRTTFNPIKTDTNANLFCICYKSEALVASCSNSGRMSVNQTHNIPPWTASEYYFKTQVRGKTSSNYIV